jgi:hypothetical protein
VGLIQKVAQTYALNPAPKILGIFCVAREGKEISPLPAPVTSLTVLPEPEILSDTDIS